MKKISGIIIILLLGVYSCKKETPANYPSVQITSPYNMETFNALANIYVKAHVSDGQQLVSISVYVANSQNTPVLSTVQIPVTSNSMDISCTYNLNDIHLNSGIYYVVVSAFNGTNVTDAFQEIYVDAVPTKRTAIYAITRNSSGVHAWKIDSTFNVSLSYTVAGNYSSSNVNSYYQQLYTTGYDSGSATAYSVPNPNLAWSIAGISSPAPYFTNVYSYNDAVFISFYQGFVKYYNYQGALQLTYYAPPGYYPIKTYLWSGYLFASAETQNIASLQTELAMYYGQSGVIYQLTSLPGPLVAMFGYDNSHILVFGNNSSGAPYIEQYNYTGNVFYSPVSILPAAQLLSAAQVNSNTYLLSFNNGTIYQFTYNPGGILPYINGVTASRIRYDSIDNEIIAGSANQVREFNYSTGSLVNSVTFADSVMDVEILYNK